MSSRCCSTPTSTVAITTTGLTADTSILAVEKPVPLQRTIWNPDVPSQFLYHCLTCALPRTATTTGRCPEFCFRQQHSHIWIKTIWNPEILSHYLHEDS